MVSFKDRSGGIYGPVYFGAFHEYLLSLGEMGRRLFALLDL
jgi:hypothetical protein